MKERSFMKENTLSKVGDNPEEKDMNMIDQEDQILSVSDSEKSETKLKSHKGHSVEKQIKELCGNVDKLTASTNWEPSKNIFDSAKKEIIKIDPDKKYEDLHDKFNALYLIFERRYNNHLMIKKAIEVKETLCNELESLTGETNYEAVKKRFDEIKEKWTLCRDIPDRFEEVLVKKYNALCDSFQDKIQGIRNVVESNTTIEKIMEKCCEEAEKLISEDNCKKAYTKFKEIEHEWGKVVSEAADFELLKKRFESSVKLFEIKKSEYIKDLENRKNEIEEKVQNIIRELEAVLSVKNAKDVLHKVKDLQKEWDRLEKTVVDNDLSRKFSKLIKKYFSNLKFIQQKEDWARWENYTNKVLLCEKAEKLLEEQDDFKIAREIKLIWEDWRKIGQAPRGKNDQIWERFNPTRQKLKVKCNNFFSNLKEERGENTEKKKKLCVRAEELSTFTDEWEAVAGELKEIQAEWKNIGPADKEIDDELYEKFRNACNKFFENRIEFYKRLHHKQSLNKNVKRDLIDEAETLKDMYWKDAIDNIRKLRSQWKRSGFANKQDEQKLWSRFNSVIEEYLAELDNSRPENLNKKEEVCNKISILIESFECEKSETEELNSQIEEFKSEWKRLGPVPRDNEIDIQNKYDGLIGSLSALYQTLLDKKAVKSMHEKKQKEDILVLIESLARNEPSEENNEKYKCACGEWSKLSDNIINDSEGGLNARFKGICDAFEHNKSDYFIKLKKEKEANLKDKIKICIELEKLVDINSSSNILSDDNNGNLAVELMFAIGGNFATNKKRLSNEEISRKVKKLQKKWAATGVVPIEDFENINLRYNKICSTIEVKIG